MEREVLEKLKTAGKITAEAREYGVGLIKPGALAIDVVDAIEEKILKLGARPAFPVNFSFNDIAAHWTPPMNDKTEMKEGDYIKLDLGAHIDGYIADTAITIRVGMNKDNLILCSEKMLSEALKIFKPGTMIGEIGETIENVAREFKFNPVRNLTGHSVERFDLHAGHVIPNVKTDNKYQIRENEVYACEPFCTPGNGFVKDSGVAQIFRWIRDVPTRNIDARRILEMSKNDFSRIPFARRWVQKTLSYLKAELAIKELTNAKAIYEYFPLREVSKAVVAQSEHTVIVKEKPIITTL